VNGVAFSAGFLLGPLVGGVLTTISWRLVFLVNVPIGIFGTIYGVYKLREPVVPLADQIFDWAGAVTFTAGLTALLLAVSLYAFPITGAWVVYVMCAVTVVSFAAFIFAEGRVRQPILNLHLLSNRIFTYATAASGLSGLARGAVLFVLIFFFQGPYGLDPLTTGILMTPFGAALLVTAPISGRLSDRYGARYLADRRTAYRRWGAHRDGHDREHDAVLGAGRLNGAHRGWIGHLLVAKYKRGDERRAAERAWRGVRHPDDGSEYRSDARYRDRIPPCPQHASCSGLVPRLSVWREG